jgi:hypothetical protein
MGSSIIPTLALLSVTEGTPSKVEIAFGTWGYVEASEGTRQKIDAMLAHAPVDNVVGGGNFFCQTVDGAGNAKEKANVHDV